MIYAVFALVAAAAGLALVWPLLRRRAGSSGRDALAVYRDQLGELERDQGRGLIDAGAATAARREIERRILTEAAAAETASPPATTHRHILAAVVIGLVVVAGGGAIYLDLGSPGLPDQPLATRTAGGSDMSAEDQANIEDMVARLEERLRSEPGDAQGWVLLANSKAVLQRYGEAAQAMTEAIALDPSNASWQSAYGEFVTLDHQGTVTPAARRAFDQALALDPAEPIARYYLAMAQAQAGDIAAALEAWRALLADATAASTWRDAVIARIGEAEQELGLEPSEVPPAMPGPTEEDMAAASQMSEQDQLTMIQGMVAGLAERLKDAPDDLEGWSRLAQSYAVLGHWEDARAAYEHALTLAPDDAALLDGLADAIANGLSRQEAIPPEAAARLDAILEKRPDNPVALYITGLAASQAEDRAKAIERWTRLRALFPEGSAEQVQVDNLLGGLQ